ncbi:hypothetical protein GCM10009098_24600 [Rheinheimera aquimaris]|uniref:Uncharacterized protein n=1 Tax=Rheinheimera aquimaris TaxID=412437 RepID=A0ABN1DYZ9_9GAMM
MSTGMAVITSKHEDIFTLRCVNTAKEYSLQTTDDTIAPGDLIARFQPDVADQLLVNISTTRPLSAKLQICT